MGSSPQCTSAALPSPVPLVGFSASLRLHLSTAWPPFLLRGGDHWPCTLAPPSAGFQGLYTNKAGKAGLSVREGQSTFFRTSRFQLAARKDLTLKHLFPAKASRGDEGLSEGMQGRVGVGRDRARVWHGSCWDHGRQSALACRRVHLLARKPMHMHGNACKLLRPHALPTNAQLHPTGRLLIKQPY